MELGRVAGADVREDGRVRWAIGNSPIDYHNCVVHAALTPEEADAEIQASLECMRAHDVPGTSMRPPDLGARLVAHGFESGGDDIGMAADLRMLPEEVPVRCLAGPWIMIHGPARLPAFFETSRYVRSR